MLFFNFTVRFRAVDSVGYPSLFEHVLNFKCPVISYVLFTVSCPEFLMHIIYVKICKY